MLPGVRLTVFDRDPDRARELAAGAVTTPGIGGANLFSYVRYDADLSDRALEEFGVTDLKVRKRVRKLDAVDQLPLLRELGRTVAGHVDIDRHFDGFLA